MPALFGENGCENERIWSRRGAVRRKILNVDPPLLEVCGSLSVEDSTRHYGMMYVQFVITYSLFKTLVTKATGSCFLII